MTLKLNLGSGNNRIDGFVSVDLYDQEADVMADICELPYANDSVDEIVCYQVIEHISYNKSQPLFDELYRVLVPGGTAIIETPDIDVVCRKILEQGLLEKWIYNLVGEYYRPQDKQRYEDWDMNAASIHRNPWNYDRLEAFVKGAGFKQLRRRPMAEKHPDYRYEENMSVCLTK
jgi:predicted SAM-dependent methyltransferase